MNNKSFFSGSYPWTWGKFETMHSLYCQYRGEDLAVNDSLLFYPVQFPHAISISAHQGPHSGYLATDILNIVYELNSQDILFSSSCSKAWFHFYKHKEGGPQELFMVEHEATLNFYPPTWIPGGSLPNKVANYPPKCILILYRGTTILIHYIHYKTHRRVEVKRDKMK